jgi:hypothetical protein
MTSATNPPDESKAEEVEVEVDIEAPTPRDAEHWAKMVSQLDVTDAPEGAVNINVTGKRLVSPIQGFGKMWQKTYKVSLAGTSLGPAEVIKEWKANFPKFWPARNYFYGGLTGIAPGDVALLNLTMPGRLKLSTGIYVLFADDESFTFMNPEGHMFAGWITFSAFEKGDATVAQAQVLIRANDPLYEAGLTMGGHSKENKFWAHTLTSLAQHLGVEDPVIETDIVCVDKKRQWKNATNVWHNAAIRSSIYTMGTPLRAIAKPFRKS